MICPDCRNDGQDCGRCRGEGRICDRCEQPSSGCECRRGFLDKHKDIDVMEESPGRPVPADFNRPSQRRRGRLPREDS